jgi:hypothetical protein
LESYIRIGGGISPPHETPTSFEKEAVRGQGQRLSFSKKTNPSDHGIQPIKW